MLKILIKWYSEIKLIGIKDWLWFVFILERDEFSHRLRMNNYHKIIAGRGIRIDHKALTEDRNRAHRIDVKLSILRNNICI